MREENRKFIQDIFKRARQRAQAEASLYTSQKPDTRMQDFMNVRAKVIRPLMEEFCKELGRGKITEHDDWNIQLNVTTEWPYAPYINFGGASVGTKGRITWKLEQETKGTVIEYDPTLLTKMQAENYIMQFVKELYSA